MKARGGVNEEDLNKKTAREILDEKKLDQLKEEYRKKIDKILSSPNATKEEVLQSIDQTIDRLKQQGFLDEAEDLSEDGLELAEKTIKEIRELLALSKKEKEQPKITLAEIRNKLNYRSNESIEIIASKIEGDAFGVFFGENPETYEERKKRKEEQGVAFDMLSDLDLSPDAGYKEIKAALEKLKEK